MGNLGNRIGRSGDYGFSTIELLIVAAVIIAVTAIAVFTLTPQRRAYRTEDAAAQVTNFLRDAHQRAITQRQTMRVEIDRATRIITITDENRLPTGDEFEVRRGKLSDEVSVDQPVVGAAMVNLPPAPFSYPAAVYSNNVWAARFRSDGSVVDSAGNPLSATVFFSLAAMTGADANLIRAVTLFGPSGSIRMWRYSGTAFDGGAN
jgi:Tfp pilus assembly protein FimT